MPVSKSGFVDAVAALIKNFLNMGDVIGGRFINISCEECIMKRSYADGMQGAAFGVIEATIMMLGVMIGLSITGDKRVLLLGVVAAGVADAVANGAAFYISEEAE